LLNKHSKRRTTSQKSQGGGITKWQSVLPKSKEKEMETGMTAKDGKEDKSH